MKTRTWLLMLLTFGALLGTVNKGFSQKSDATTNGGNRYQPSFPYKVYPSFYQPMQIAELTGNPTGLKNIGSFVTSTELDTIILEPINHCVALDGFTWHGGKTPVFTDASLIDSMIIWGMYELKEEHFPNTRYKVSAKDTKLSKLKWEDGAAEGLSQVLYLNPNLIPYADDSGSYHLWPISRLSCVNGLIVDKLTEFPKVNFVQTPAKQAVASNGATVPGKTIIIEGDTIIVEGDVIKKQATAYEEPSGYQYESGYSYQPNYYGGGYSSGCGFGVSASLNFGYGYGGGYSSSCGGGYSNNSSYCGGGNYGGGYGGDNYYNSYYYDNSINNSFNTDYDHSFNNYQTIPFTPANPIDFPGQQGGGYADNNGNDDNDDNNNGGGGGDVPGQQGGSDNGKWAAGSGFGRNTAASWNQKTSAIKAENSLPSFAGNKTGAVKSTNNVTNRNDASSWSSDNSAAIASRGETAQHSTPENKPTIEYRGRSGAEEKAAVDRSNTNNQSRYNAPDQEMRGREGAAVVATRNEGGGNFSTRTSGNTTASSRQGAIDQSTKVGERSGAATNASREQSVSVQKSRNTEVGQPSTTRTGANMQANRTPTSPSSSNMMSSQKRQTTNQGGGSVSQRTGTNTGSGGSVSNRPGATR